MNFKLDIGDEEDIFTKEQMIKNRKKRLEIVKEMNRETEKRLEEEIEKLQKSG